MKFLLALYFLLTAGMAISQPKAKKQKAPTQKDLESSMKEAQAMMDEAMKEMSDEDRRMMDSMGIKMPDMKKMKVPKVTDQELAAAWEDDGRVVPKKDDARIASIPKQVTTARLNAYIAAIQQKMIGQLDSKTIAAGKKILDRIKTAAQSKQQAGSMAVSIWLAGQPELSLYLLGELCMEDINQPDNLSSYAAALTMQGGEHLAIPILQNLNEKYKGNTSILNNLGQAWFGLGDLSRAGKYLDSAIAIYPFHPQANLTKAAIEESKGNTAKAADCLKRSIRHSYTKEKEEKLAKMDQKLDRKDLMIPFKPGADPLGLEKTKRPDYPLTIAQVNALLPQWDLFNHQCDEMIQKIRKEMEGLTAQHEQSSAALAKATIAVINQGGLPVIREPLFARKASLNLNERTSFYALKMKKDADNYMRLQDDLNALRKKYLPPAPEAPCDTRRDAVNAQLKALNERKKLYDEEAITLYRHYCNDLAYWSQYTALDAREFRLIALSFQLFWVQKNRELQPLDMQTYKGVAFECVEDESAKPGELAEFDDVACNYRSVIDFGIVKQEISCSHTTTTYEVGAQTIIEREVGNKFIGSTIIVKPSISGKGKAGPLQVEAYIKGEFTVELDENRDVKDWSGTVNTGVETSAGTKSGPVKVKGSVKNEFQIEMSPRGIDDVILVGEANLSAGAYGQSVKIGVEDRVSLVSGHGSVTTKGIMGRTTVSSW